ncbi:5-methylthioadenosine/S-adenosylhomocysteine deaminase [Halorubrum alkaliphilum]|uniref:5-methylthioadenosine/S-adenosylhomocysteine deaminase n=1 Tax=Halorubrum alkaliphilum TaxID=261290 RepID=A0A8T4GEK3_9EURY|nr:amidohydrolase [Halorubrum alkaliphilum]MBP1921891.1 5-methylthioadenosine/S-adenosylhomocysteine deaminase [Halorubrum alkaliphilum]
MNTLCVTGGRALRPDGRVERADVVIDRDAGTIRAVGAPNEVADATDAATETLDAEGSLVIPGLVNAHTHVAMTLLRGYADDKPLDAWLREDIWPVEAELTPDDVEAGAELGVVEMIRSGTTAFADMYFAVDRVADVVDRAGLRARLGHGAVTVGKDDAAAAADVEESLAVAAELDGAADGRIRTAFMPHSLTTVGEEFLREGVDEAREAGVPIHLHANETTDEVDPIVDEGGQRPIEYADDIGVLGPEDFFAHGVHVDGAEIDLLAESGTAVVHCPASNMKLASGMAPVQRMRDAGVTVALGTDGAASNNDLDLFDEMRDAAMVGKLAAEDASAVPAEAVVEMATAAGADALGLPGGRIAEGAAADLAVVDLDAPHLTPVHDLVSHLAYAASGHDVRHTVCDGEVLMRDRDVLTLDVEAVRERAAEAAAGVVARAEDAG